MNILHKLGLYKKSEIDELISTVAALSDSIDGVIAEAHDAEEWYKIILQMFNEAQTVEHAVDVIKHYCAAADCTECRFGKCGKCMFAHTAPYCWEVKK